MRKKLVHGKLVDFRICQPIKGSCPLAMRLVLRSSDNKSPLIMAGSLDEANKKECWQAMQQEVLQRAHYLRASVLGASCNLPSAFPLVKAAEVPRADLDDRGDTSYFANYGALVPDAANKEDELLLNAQHEDKAHRGSKFKARVVNKTMKSLSLTSALKEGAYLKKSALNLSKHHADEQAQLVDDELITCSSKQGITFSVVDDVNRVKRASRKRKLFLDFQGTRAVSRYPQGNMAAFADDKCQRDARFNSFAGCWSTCVKQVVNTKQDGKALERDSSDFKITFVTTDDGDLHAISIFKGGIFDEQPSIIDGELIHELCKSQDVAYSEQCADFRNANIYESVYGKTQEGVKPMADETNEAIEELLKDESSSSKGIFKNASLDLARQNAAKAAVRTNGRPTAFGKSYIPLKVQHEPRRYTYHAVIVACQEDDDIINYLKNVGDCPSCDVIVEGNVVHENDVILSDSNEEVLLATKVNFIDASREAYSSYLKSLVNEVADHASFAANNLGYEEALHKHLEALRADDSSVPHLSSQHLIKSSSALKHTQNKS